MRQKVSLVLKQLLSYVPTLLPVGLTAYNVWADSIVELAGPIADVDSMKWVIGNEIQRMNSGVDRRSKQAFVRIIRKFAANQVAAQSVLEIRTRHDKKIAEATAQAAQELASNEQKN